MTFDNLHIHRIDIRVMNEYLELVGSDLPELERVANAFILITDFHIKESQKEIELARAMSDQDNLVKEQIKRNVIEFAQSIFNDAYWRVTGRKVRDDKE